MRMPECTDNPGTNVMALEAGEGNTVTLWRRNMDQETRSFQAWLEFDPTCLQVESIVCNPDGDPYGLSAACYYDNETGIVNLIQCQQPGSPTSATDAPLAVIAFTALGDAPDGVNFRRHTPHNLYASLRAREVVPCLKGTGPIPLQVAMPGDVTADGKVDACDLAALLSAYGHSRGEPEYNEAADFNGSGKVDLADLSVLLAKYE